MMSTRRIAWIVALVASGLVGGARSGWSAVDPQSVYRFLDFMISGRYTPASGSHEDWLEVVVSPDSGEITLKSNRLPPRTLVPWTRLVAMGEPHALVGFILKVLPELSAPGPGPLPAAALEDEFLGRTFWRDSLRYRTGVARDRFRALDRDFGGGVLTRLQAAIRGALGYPVTQQAAELTQGYSPSVVAKELSSWLTAGRFEPMHRQYGVFRCFWGEREGPSVNQDVARGGDSRP